MAAAAECVSGGGLTKVTALLLFALAHFMLRKNFGSILLATPHATHDLIRLGTGSNTGVNQRPTPHTTDCESDDESNRIELGSSDRVWSDGAIGLNNPPQRAVNAVRTHYQPRMPDRQPATVSSRAERPTATGDSDRRKITRSTTRERRANDIMHATSPADR